MLQEQLKEFGQKMTQMRIILLGLGVWNFVLLDLEMTSFSEKIISTIMSCIYIYFAVKGENMKTTITSILVMVIISNGIIGYLDFDFFIRQSIGSFVEILVLGYQLKMMIEEEGKVIELESKMNVEYELRELSNI